MQNSLFKKKHKIKDFTFIDLFAGIGGIRLGLEKAGGKCVFSSEWDKHSQTTYQTNFGETPAGDITKIEPSDIPTFDVLAAGFPCQPFSQAGLERGFADTRGTLFFDIAKILNHHRPKVVFLENVKRLRSHDNGRTLAVINRVLSDLGYGVENHTLNAKDFGLPQNRERLFIIGFLGSAPFNFPDPLNKNTRLGNILEKNVPDKYTISDRLWAGHQRRLREHQERGNGFGFSLFDDDSKYTSTISARYYKDGSEILIEQKGRNPRRLTPREAARLQGFPESFIIPVSDNQAYKQFGNSVAVPVIESVALKIFEAMQEQELPKEPVNIIDIDSIKTENLKKVMALVG